MLKRKMLRDIVNYKVQFISIFLMAFIGVFVFAGMYVETTSFETTMDNYYEDTNLADGWIYSNYLVDEFLYFVDHLGATTQMERHLVVDSQAILENNPDIILHFVENNTISKFYLVEGKELDINDSEGVWLDKSFADARNLKIGDEITFEANGTQIKKKIRGVGYSPEYVYVKPITATLPNHTSNGFAYLSHKAFPSDNTPYNVLNVKFQGTPGMYLQLLTFRLDGYFTSFLERSNHHSVNVVEESNSQLQSLSSLFPPIFIILSMLMLSTTMKRIISHQRHQIGILKANGFKNYIIAIHYLLPGFILVTLGSLSGVIVGPVVIHILASPSRTLYFKYPYWNSIGLTNSIIVVILMGLIAVMVSYYSIEKIINESPSTIIKPEVPKATTSSFVEKFKIWKKLSFNIRWNYRNIKRNRYRSIITVLGVIGCTVLLITGFGIYEGIDEAKEWYFDDVTHFESKMIIEDDMNLSQIESIAQKVNGTPIMEESIEILGNETELVSLMVLKESDLITMTDDSHEGITIPDDEVSVSKKLSDRLNISVGDTIECKLTGSDKKVKIRIDKIHTSPYLQGLVMSPDKLRKTGLNFTPTAIVTQEHVTQHYDGITTVYKNDLISDFDKMEETSMMIITIMVFLGIILSIVILYNLCVQSFTEMKNEIATLKTLGFESKSLTKLFATQSIFLIIISFILGIPIGYCLLSIMMPAFGDNIYLVPSISLTNMAITFIVIISVSIIMTLYFSRKIEKFNLVNYLKD